MIAANEPFTTIWQTPNAAIRIDAIGEFTYSWKDLNNVSHTGSGNGGSASGSVSSTNISFGAAGRYQLEITPAAGAYPFSHIEMNYGYPHASYLREIAQWGDIAWSSMAFAFMDAQNLSVTASDVPDLSRVTDMSQMFLGCSALATIPHIDQWDVSHVTDMSRLFGLCMLLTNIPGISSWNVGNVTDMSGMFGAAHLFNEDISGWNVSQVENMENMFADASAFNIDISGWDVSRVTNMREMFYVATSFNQPIGKWKSKTGKVQSTMAMFSSATAFNQDLDEWDMSMVTDMQQMFYGATAFNGNISNWDVSKVEYMSFMFAGATSFNRDIGSWNVSSVMDMSSMFANATSFNRNIGGWNVRKVTNTSYMFSRATAFNQNLGGWELNALKVSIFSSSAEGMLSYSGLDCSNYSKTLIGWAENSANMLMNIKLGADGLVYGTGGQAARGVLTTVNKWTITGDNYDGSCSILLPVNFGAVTAIFKNNRLHIRWATLSETNNSYFDIEVSKNGKVFTKLETVSSKAVNGMSDTLLDYEYTITMQPAVSIAGLSVFILGLLFFGSCRKRKTVCFVALIFVLGFTSLISCQKNNSSVEASAQMSQLFIRIKQVDKNGNFEYSKVVKAVME
ncbi:hypothetical protein GCM10027516_16580 [Niabella aquatica]